MKFAEGTTVAVSKTRGQIEELAAKHGATRFASGWTEKGAAINFVCRGRLLRFVLPVPDREEIARELRKRRRSFPTAKMIDDAAAAEERRCCWSSRVALNRPRTGSKPSMKPF
jgi:hypothetical protein